MNKTACKEDQFLTINAAKMKSVASALFKVVLAFGFIFNLSFSAAPSLSTGRLTLLIMIVLYGKDTFKLIVSFAQQYSFPVALFLFLLPFSMFWLTINGPEDSVMFSRALWFFVFSILSVFLYVRMCRLSLHSAMAYYLIAMLIQALLVFTSMLNPDFRNWVDQALVNSGNINFSEGAQFAGLSNGGGAGLSLQLGLGVVASLVLFSQAQGVARKWGLVLAAVIISIATIFVARTGLYLSVLTMLGFIFLSRRSLIIPIMLIVSTLAAYVLVAGSDVAQLKNNNMKLERTVNWAFDFVLSGESSTFDDLVSQVSGMRELGVSELLVGSGRITEHDGSNYSGQDSGYLQTLFALGLPLTISFYAALFMVYWRILLPVRGELKAIGSVLVVLVFILEMKEPFIFKYTLPFFVLVFVYLARLQMSRKA